MELKQLFALMLAVTRSVKEVEANIVAQKRIIADLQTMGHDTKAAEQTLRIFEVTQFHLATEANRVQFTLDTLPLFEGKAQH
jgi:hypothetical protein